MIRHCFPLQIIPNDENEWGQLVAQAMWLEGFKAKLIGQEMNQLFAPVKTKIKTGRRK